MNASVVGITTTTVRRARRRDPRVRSIVQPTEGERGGRARGDARVGSTGPRALRDAAEDAEREGRPECETMKWSGSLDVRRRDRHRRFGGGRVARRAPERETTKGLMRSTTIPIEHAIERREQPAEAGASTESAWAPTARSQQASADRRRWPVCRASRWRPPTMLPARFRPVLCAFSVGCRRRDGVVTPWCSGDPGAARLYSVTGVV